MGVEKVSRCNTFKLEKSLQSEEFFNDKSFSEVTFSMKLALGPVLCPICRIPD